LLENVQKNAERNKKGLIKDVAITVPHYFTNNQRQAILDAAKIAQLNVLGLIESNLAAAFQYGMERSRTFSNITAEEEFIFCSSYFFIINFVEKRLLRKTQMMTMMMMMKNLPQNQRKKRILLGMSFLLTWVLHRPPYL
jgi:hypothetical protein